MAGWRRCLRFLFSVVELGNQESTIRMLRITTLLFGFGNNASAFVLMYGASGHVVSCRAGLWL